MRMIIMTLTGANRPEDYAALVAYLRATFQQKPSEVVCMAGVGQPGSIIPEKLAADFGIQLSRVHGGMAQFTAGVDADGQSNAHFLGYGDAVTYAMDAPNPVAVVVGSGPTQEALRLRSVCENYSVPCHFVRVAPVAIDQQLIAVRDVTPQQPVPQVGIAAQPTEPYIFAQSHSSLNVFETCPRQYEAKYITKEDPFVQSAEAQWGDDVHCELENYLKAQGNYQLPNLTFTKDGVVQSLQAFKPKADWILQRALGNNGVIQVERKLALNKAGEAQDYSAKGRWLGGKIDVTILYPATAAAEVFDWKTGKQKDDRAQLQMYGMLTLAQHPNINQVGAGYVWLPDDVISPPSYYVRHELNSYLEVWRNKYERLRQAYSNGVFPPKPNGLCKKWCNVKRCEYHGKGRQ